MTILAGRRTDPPDGLLRGIRRDVEAGATEHGVSPRAAWIIAAFPVVGGFLTLVTFAYRPLFRWLLREDHPVEWTQFTLNMITAAVAVMATAGFVRRRQWLAALTFAGLALGSFVLGGEEISWGQRAFAFATPADMARENVQGEFNIHNLEGHGGGLDVAQALRLTELAIGLGGVVLPLLVGTARGRLRRSRYLRAVSPPIFLAPAFAMAFVVRLADLALRAVGMLPDALVYYLEWGELCLDLGLAGMAVCARAPMISWTSAHRFLIGGDDEGAVPSPITAGVVIVTVLVLAATAGLAMMTMLSGVMPGNVKG